jgi:hypothetical protein
VRQTTIIASSVFSHLTQEVQMLKKVTKLPLLSAEKPSEDINSRLFLMNKRGVMSYLNVKPFKNT